MVVREMPEAVVTAWLQHAETVRVKALRAQESAARALLAAARENHLARCSVRLGAIDERVALALHASSDRHRAAANTQLDYACRLAAEAGNDAHRVLRPGLMGVITATTGWPGAVMVLCTDEGEKLVAASDGIAHQAHELEVALGEGPSWEALNGHAITVQGSEVQRRWRHYGPAVSELDVQALSAVPLHLDHTGVRGALTVTGTAEPTSRSDACALDDFANALRWMLLSSPAGIGDERDLPILTLFGDEDSQHTLHVAAGMVSERCRLGLHDAIALIRAHAYAEQRAVVDVATDILHGSVPEL
jgi:hypothetical protein